jgi:hypothetical protein
MTAMANHHSNLIFHRNIKCKRAIFHSKLLARLPGGPFPRNGSLDGLDGPSCASFQLLPAASSCFQLLPAASRLVGLEIASEVLRIEPGTGGTWAPW